MNSTGFKLMSTLTLCAFLGVQATAQSVIDAGKYGQVGSFGTARSVGFGNALGSVGADFASLSVNPAGIGVYRSSEFMFTPGLRFNGTNSSYIGNSSDDNGTRFGLNNIGAVFTSTPSDRNYDRADWKATSFGIGLNRVADFSRTYNYEGRNTTSSASQYFEADALQYPNSTTQDVGTPAYFGYQSYLLSNNYISLVPYQAGINQQKIGRERGGTTEMAISLGGNYQDKLMIGATLGIDFLNHRTSTSVYEETPVKNSSDSFDNFTYRESYRTNGSGINLKLGAIYRFSDYFRAGVAFHTPTAYTLKEVSTNDINVSSLMFGVNSVMSPENEYEYSFYSPLKAIVSATGMLGKYGFISLDYEYVGYGGMRFSMEDEGLQNSLNQRMRNLYASNSNIRIGTEIRLDDFRLRAGYGFYGSPFQNKLYQSDRNNISFGFGYRFGKTFIDFAVINSSFKTYEQPYVLDGSMGYTQPPVATIQNNLTTGMVTLGWKL